MDISPASVGRFLVATAAAAGWLLTNSGSQDTPDVRTRQSSVDRQPRLRFPILDSRKNFSNASGTRPRQKVAAIPSRTDLAPL
jgi:hypothetical protein